MEREECWIEIANTSLKYLIKHFILDFHSDILLRLQHTATTASLLQPSWLLLEWCQCRLKNGKNWIRVNAFEYGCVLCLLFLTDPPAKWDGKFIILKTEPYLICVSRAANSYLVAVHTRRLPLQKSVVPCPLHLLPCLLGADYSARDVSDLERPKR